MSSISWTETELMDWSSSYARGYIAAPFFLMVGYLVVCIQELASNKSLISPENEQKKGSFKQPGVQENQLGNPGAGNKYEIGEGGS